MEEQQEVALEPEVNVKKEPEADVKKEPEVPSLQQILLDQATEEDEPVGKGNLSLRKVIGGDILTVEIVRSQIWVLMLITLFVLFYIAQRYSCQKYVVEISKLQDELVDAKYRELSVKSELTEQTRQSKILDMLKANNDSLLHISDRPPFIITIPDE